MPRGPRTRNTATHRHSRVGRVGDYRYARAVSHGGRSDPRFCKFVSGRSVGRSSSVRRSDHRSRHTTAKPRATPKPTRPSPPCRSRTASSWRVRARHRSESVSVHVPANDPSRTPSGKPRPALRARLPAGRQRATHRSTDDDSRYRFARYVLSTPEHSRLGRPSSPCPAVAGAKPRDDGLRVSSRLPPRSRLGTVTKRARAIPAGRSSAPGRSVGRYLDSRQREPRHDGRVSRAAPGAQDGRYEPTPSRPRRLRSCRVHARVSKRSRRGHSYSHTNRGRSHAGTPAVSPSCDRPAASARPRADRRSEARVPGRAPARVTGRSCCKTEIPG